MKRILVVDDAATVRAYHRKILHDGGFKIHEAVNGLEGMEKLMSEKYDIILVDVNMPKMDGYSLVQAIRNESKLNDIPTIMISTEAQANDAEAAYAAGANFYLIKPVTPEELLTAVRMVAGK